MQNHFSALEKIAGPLTSNLCKIQLREKVRQSHNNLNSLPLLVLHIFSRALLQTVRSQVPVYSHYDHQLIPLLVHVNLAPKFEVHEFRPKNLNCLFNKISPMHFLMKMMKYLFCWSCEVSNKFYSVLNTSGF